MAVWWRRWSETHLAGLGAAIVTVFLLAATLAIKSYPVAIALYSGAALSLLLLATTLREAALSILRSNRLAAAAFAVMALWVLVHAALVYPSLDNLFEAPVFAAYLLMLLAAGIAMRDHWLAFGRLAVAIFAVAAVASLVRYLPYAIASSWNTRLGPLGRLKDPIVGASAYMLILAVGVAAIAAETSRIARAMLVLALLPIVALIVLTLSRSVYFAAVLATLILLVLDARSRQRLWLYLAVAAGVAAVLAVIVDQSDLLRSIALSLLTKGVSLRDRAFAIAAEGIAARPLFGAEPGVVFDPPSRMVAHPHNVFLSIAFYYGIVPGLAYLAVLFSALYSSLARARKDALPIAVLAGYLIVFNVDGANPFAPWTAVWLIVWSVLVLTLVATSPAADRGNPVEDRDRLPDA
jgi:O-antigen ligase